jgi:muramoyltetrapeptide carboxypeptidase LdcA involved in peptidoglycan recycling
MGFSDTTTLTTYLNQLGLVTFNGPSIMAGFSQRNSLSIKFQNYISDFLFGNIEKTIYPTFDFYSNGYPDWNKTNNVGKINETFQNNGPHRLQGDTTISGELYGGCIEVLEFMKSTNFWPKNDFWENKIFFLETSESKPSVEQVKWMLRNYGMQGVFNKISALMFGRARDYTQEEKEKLDEILLQTIK